LKYKLRKSAEEDIKGIGRYSLSKFGVSQRNKYLHGLASHFEKIANNPKIYKKRNDIKAGLYCSEFEQHFVFYKIENDVVDILAVLHKRMLPENHLLEL